MFATVDCICDREARVGLAVDELVVGFSDASSSGTPSVLIVIYV